MLLWGAVTFRSAATFRNITNEVQNLTLLLGSHPFLSKLYINITITFNSFWDINHASRRAIVQRKTKIWKEQNYEYLYNTAAIN